VSLNAQVSLTSSSAGRAADDRTVEVRAFYRRNAPEQGSAKEQTLPSNPRNFSVTVGTTQQKEILVQVAECLADGQRVGASEGGCRIGIELRLLDASGGTLAIEVVEPTTPTAPGGTLDLGTVTLAEVGAVEIAPVADSRVRVGRTLPLTAVAKNNQGTVVDRLFRWSSSDETVAQVDPTTGVVTGVKAGGPVTVTASSGGKRGEVTLSVVQRVAKVDVTPGTVDAKVNGTVQLTATPKDETDAALTDRTVEWVADNSGFFTVSPSGIVTGVRPGTGELTVTVEEKQQKVPVTVTAGGITVAPSPASVAVDGTTPLTATVTDANGTPITTQSIVVTWTSDKKEVAEVDASTGVVTGRSVGQATIMAAGGGASGQGIVNVYSVVLPVAPANPTIQAARTVQLTVQGALGAVQWQSSDPAVADVSASGGVVTGRRPGTVTITATAGAQTGNTSVTVTAARVDVTPNAATVEVGATVSLSSVVRDADGAAIPNVPVSWESNNIATATVNPATGAVTGVAAGPATITARGGGASGTSQMTVSEAVVASVELTPREPASLLVGNTLQLTVSVKDARGNPLAGRSVNFRSSVPGIASVTPENTATGPTGIASTTVTAKAAGSATITAASGANQASLAVTVSPLPPSRIEKASPDNPTCPVNTNLCQFAVKVTDNLGQPVAGALVRWSANCSIGEVTGGAGGPDDSQGDPSLLVIATDAQGISATSNRCTSDIAWKYSQTAELVANGAKQIFNFTLTAEAGWEVMPSPTDRNLGGVWGSSGADVFAVGDFGTIVRFDGSNWVAQKSGVDANLKFIWGSSATAIYAVGDGSTILRYDGSSWSRIGVPENLSADYGGFSFYGVWGTSADNVFIVGTSLYGRYVILRYDGSTLSPSFIGQETGANIFFAVWGSSPTDVYAAGTGGTILRFNGSAWSAVESGTQRTITGLWGASSENIIAVGDAGTILRYDGRNWTSMPNPLSATRTDLHGVWGRSATSIVAVGANSAIVHFDGSSWAAMPSSVQTSLDAVWASSDAGFVVVGNAGTILRRTSP
jgi:uncharacterized protein YjdB